MVILQSILYGIRYYYLVKYQLDEKCWREAQFKPPLHNHNNDSIINELNNKKLYSSYYTVMEGEYGKMSRFVDVYVVWEDDVMYIYIRG